jgi:hypothetical protein
MDLTRRAARADAFFAIYYQMGSARSIEALYATATRLGLRVSTSTLRRYSTDYRWQARIAELDAQAADEEVGAVRAVQAMNRRQAAAGAALLDLGVQALTALDARTVDARSAARLIEAGARVERLAMGEATTRTEITVSVYSKLVVEVVGLFASINELPDAAERRRRFALGLDGIVDRYIEADGNPRTIDYADYADADDAALVDADDGDA